MTFQELITFARQTHLDDTVDPYLWSDEQLFSYAGEAERQACRRGSCELILDEKLYLNLIAGQVRYALDLAILKIERVIWTDSNGDKIIEKTSERSLDNLATAWRQAEADKPTSYYVRGRFLYLDRAPTTAVIEQDATLNLQIWREPFQCTDLDAEPEIHLQHHEALAHWIAYRAFLLPDYDTRDIEQAQLHLSLFDQHFGDPLSASDIEYQIASTKRVQHLAAIPYRDHHRRSSSGWVRELR